MKSTKKKNHVLTTVSVKRKSKATTTFGGGSPVWKVQFDVFILSSMTSNDNRSTKRKLLRRVTYCKFDVLYLTKKKCGKLFKNFDDV